MEAPQSINYPQAAAGLPATPGSSTTAAGFYRVVMKKDEELDELYEAEIRKLKQGFLNFVCSKTMKLGIRERVIVEIFKTPELMTTNSAGDTEKILVGSFMKVTLQSSSFEITSFNSAAQLVSSADKACWNWDVLPVKAGASKLSVVVSVRLKVPNATEEYKDYPLIEKIVLIEVARFHTVKTFVQHNWQWLIATIIGSGVLWELLKLFLEKLSDD